MADPQLIELSRVTSRAMFTGFFKIIFPILILGGLVNLLIIFLFRKKKK